MDLSVITTYRCNSNCQMCYIWQNPTRPNEEIQAETLAKLPAGFDNLNLTGGEPTLRRDLPQLVETVYPKARITEISSNGLHAYRLVEIVRKHPDIKIRFSIEGKDVANNSIRGEWDGFRKKMEGMKRLKEAGGKDLGFATVIQDENAAQLVELYGLSCEMGLELATSTLHNGWQFFKNDNYFYDRARAAREVEKLIAAMLKSRSVKAWFRAYLNLGLMRKILGQDRLMPCTAGTDFAFIDPWGDVWACNVRTDVPLGNLKRQSWAQILSSEMAQDSVRKVAQCPQNCWMVTTARAAMRSRRLPFLPKLRVLEWVIKNKIRTALGLNVRFDRYVDYSNVAQSPSVQRTSFLDRPFPRKVLAEADKHYALEEFHNR